MEKDSQSQKFQPLVALRALKTLVNDPERTDQVFVVIKAMSGDAVRRSFAKFCLSRTGRDILNEKRSLLEKLQDRQALRQLPEGSLGRHYLSFVENQDLSADGLVEASQDGDVDLFEDPDLKLFSERLRDMHDLWHVTTDYGRDTFGEACLLAFTYAQTRNRGIGIIAVVGMLKLMRQIDSGVPSAMWQAWRDGRKAEWLPAQDWEGLLSEPVEQVRCKLNISQPERYHRVFSELQTA